jgi:hypothetical protein
LGVVVCRLQTYWSNNGTIMWIVNNPSAPPIIRRKPMNSCLSPSPSRSPVRTIPTAIMLTIGVSISKIMTTMFRIADAMLLPMLFPSRPETVGVSTSSSKAPSKIAYLFIFSLIPSHTAGQQRWHLPPPGVDHPRAHLGSVPFPGIFGGHDRLSPPPPLRGLMPEKRLPRGHGDGGRGSYLSSSPSSPRSGPIAALYPLFHRDLAAASVRRGVRQALKSYRRFFK